MIPASNEPRSRNASIEQIDVMLRTIDAALDPFVVPIIIGKNTKLEADTIWNGTGILVRNGNRAHLLATCNHVRDEWRKAGAGTPGAFVVLLGSGHTAVEIKSASIQADAAADLATVCFPHSQLMDSQKSFYPLDEIGCADAHAGDILLAVGYPGMWRRSTHHQSTFSRTILPFTVTDVAREGFVAAELANMEVLSDLDKFAADLGRDRDALCGMSGAPVFNVYERPFKLAGFVRERGCGGVFFAHARSLLPLAAAAVAPDLESADRPARRGDSHESGEFGANTGLDVVPDGAHLPPSANAGGWEGPSGN
jgi:hypothetical protein